MDGWMAGLTPFLPSSFPARFFTAIWTERRQEGRGVKQVASCDNETRATNCCRVRQGSRTTFTSLDVVHLHLKKYKFVDVIVYSSPHFNILHFNVKFALKLD